ncbi:class-II fumarase/aspartase family protein [Acuticoccus yangtzensis]|uniref:class-II fumarase/aspartase family protein n=1 Tax=Acuticoccus yangtzensis TaxID=1443441 RepID=UPI00094962A3|nr:adenylosuccinate lyase family protein [Acuticoccus yangtzensis]
MMSAIVDGLLAATPAFRDTARLFDDRSTVEAYLEFERALAEVQGALGVIPAAAAERVAALCRADSVDLDALRDGAGRVGYPIVPLVAMLAERAGADGEWLHFATTSQDAMDTGLVLQLVAARPLVMGPLDEAIGTLAALTQAHRATPMAGRSKLQHAAPITFGYRCAVWLDQIARRAAALSAAFDAAAVVQFGGAVGTLSALGADGAPVRAALARRLGLGVPDITWHVSRDRLADLVHALVAAQAALAKMAGDITFLMSTEVAELREPYAAGRGSSSTMPQKRNPVLCEAIIEAARRGRSAPAEMLEAMLQDQDRAIGTSYLERGAIVSAVTLTAGAAAVARDLLAGLEVDTERMASNLGATHGLIYAEAAMMALSATHGRVAAHSLLHGLCHTAAATGRDLAAVAAEEGYALPPAVFDVAGSRGAQDVMIDAVLARIAAAHGGAVDGGAPERPVAAEA